MAFESNPDVTGIEHMPFAVRDADKALATYQRLLGVPENVEVQE